MKINFDQIAKSLLSNAGNLLPQWLPGGKFEGDEYTCGDLSGGAGDSLKFNIAKGFGKDFATGEQFGDIISLFAAIHNCTQAEAARILSPESFNSETKTFIPSKPPRSQSYSGHHFKHGEPSIMYEYRDQRGDLLHYVARYDLNTGKQIVPWSWSEGRWHPKGWPPKRPLYGLPLRPEKNILIVEGEKAADALRPLLEAYDVITWSSGVSNWDKADWSPVYGRKILLWPDRDRHKVETDRQAKEFNMEIGQEFPYEMQPGSKAMINIAQHLFFECPEIKILDVSDIETPGYDAADFIAAGGTKDTFYVWAKTRVKVIKDANTVLHERLPIDSPLDSKGEIRQITAPVPAGQRMSIFEIKESMPSQGYKGKIIANIANLKHLIDCLGINVRYNVIKKREEFIIPGETFSIDNKANASFAWLQSECETIGMPRTCIGEYLTYIADKNSYNPIATWITSKPWDGVSRLSDIYGTLLSTNDNLKQILMRRWFLSAVAAIFNPDGVSAHGVLILQGEQYLGKTAWFKSLVPPIFEATADGMILDPSDKDSVKQICSYWLVELGEIDATFKKSDMSRLKAFLTKDRDKLRAAFAKQESEYARRTVFFGSVNPRQFLHDESGNRRFWTVECAAINHKHGLDMQQIWAEFFEIYKTGETWFLTHQEMTLLNEHNESFMSRDAVEDRIATDLAWNSPQNIWEWKTATQVLNELGYDKPTRSDLIKAGGMLLKYNGAQQKYIRGVNLKLVPGRVKSDESFWKSSL